MPAVLICSGLLVGAASAGETGGAAKPKWPGNVRVVDAQLNRTGPPAKEKGSRSLPQLRAYDTQGRRLAELVGYNPETLRSTMASVLAPKGPAAGDPLSADLARVLGVDGKPLALPAADVTLVKYWADWCVPCHAQTADLVNILGARPGVRVNLVHVDVDFGTASKDGPRRMIKLSPEAEKKLQDPNLSDEEKMKILREAIEAEDKGEKKPNG